MFILKNSSIWRELHLTKIVPSLFTLNLNLISNICHTSILRLSTCDISLLTEEKRDKKNIAALFYGNADIGTATVIPLFRVGSIVSGCFTRSYGSFMFEIPVLPTANWIKGKWTQPHPASLHIPRRSPSSREITVISSFFFLFLKKDSCPRWNNLKKFRGLIVQMRRLSENSLRLT